jgi:hypothetical protein
MKKIKFLNASLIVFALSVIFGVIACFANTQVVINLVYGALSLMYAARAAACCDFLDDINRLFNGSLVKGFSTTVSIIDGIIEIDLHILTILSIIGLVRGVIELSLINIGGILWWIAMSIYSIAAVIKIIKDEETEETTELEEE